MKCSSIILTGLFLASAAIHAMEITEKDFGFKTKDRSWLGNLCYATDDRKLPYFINENDSHRTFANHELLWAYTMNIAGVVKDITNQILHTRYRQIMSNSYMGKNFKFIKWPLHTPFFDKNPFYTKICRDLFWSNKSQQKTYYYLMMYAQTTPEKNFVIEGANIQFSREIEQQIDNLSKSIKKSLSRTSHNPFYIQTSEPTFLNACLGEDETRVNNIKSLACTTQWATTGISLATTALVCSFLNEPLQEDGAKAITQQKCIDPKVLIAALISGSIGKCADNYIINTLTAPDDNHTKMLRSGFEKRSFLPDKK